MKTAIGILILMSMGVAPTWAIPIAPSSIQSVSPSDLVQQGRDLYQNEQFTKAVEIWERAYTQQSDRASQAMVLSNLSLAYQQLGQWEKATKATASSFELLQNNPNPQVLAQALSAQGSLQLALGQPQQALDTWQKATDAYTQAKDEVGVTRSLINQAQALQALGLYRRAVVTLNSVNQKLQKQPTSLLKTAGLRNLGNVLRVVGDL
jgi:tetratricopeptide (TPR) repeat protein